MAGFSTPIDGLHSLATILSNFKTQFDTSNDGADSELASIIGMEYHQVKDLIYIWRTRTSNLFRQSMGSLSLIHI